MKDNDAASYETNPLLPIKLTIDGETIVLLIDYQTAISFRNGEELFNSNQKKAA